MTMCHSIHKEVRAQTTAQKDRWDLLTTHTVTCTDATAYAVFHLHSSAVAEEETEANRHTPKQTDSASLL